MSDNKDNAGTDADAQSGAQRGTPGAGAPPADTRTFTQAEVDAILGDRLARERKQFSDYEDLKAKAKKLDEQEEAAKDELTKAQDAQKKAEAERDAAMQTALTTARRAEILRQAVQAGAVDPDVVVALLASDTEITVEADGTVKGAKKAVEDLLKVKTYLKATTQAGGTSGGEFNGQPAASVDQQIKELEAKGDRQSLAQARSLKVNKFLALSR